MIAISDVNECNLACKDGVACDLLAAGQRSRTPVSALMVSGRSMATGIVAGRKAASTPVRSLLPTWAGCLLPERAQRYECTVLCE